MARNMEKNGAAGLLLLPHYLTETSTEGVCRHVEAVCAAISLGVIVYDRNVQLERSSVGTPCFGVIDNMVSIRRRLGDRFSYLGGPPRAEVYAVAYKQWVLMSIRQPFSMSFHEPLSPSTRRSPKMNGRRRQDC
jgi:5-dehydro-4-deoxyglucarate dehydratase